MKLHRPLLLGAAAIVGLGLVAAVVVFNSSFQTWAVRRALAGQPGWRIAIGSVSAGLKHAEAKDVRVERDGVVLVLPAVEADLPLFSAALREKVSISRLVAKGWTLDLSKTAPPAATPGGAAPAGAASMMAPPAAAARAFTGIFSFLQLPADFSLDGVQLDGEVILPAAGGRGKIAFTGGGLAAGTEGRFDLVSSAALAGADVSALEVRGALRAFMDTPRTFGRVSARLDAAARGVAFPQGVKLTADLAATRSARGENYAIAVVGGDRPLLSVQAALPAEPGPLAGTWKLDVRDADVAPFTLGRPLPAFTAVGEGKFETDPGFVAPHVAGSLQATADRLGVLDAKLASLGALKLTAEFDLAQRGDALAVQTFQAAVAGAHPIATVRAVQSFALDLKTRRIEAADAARELFGVSLQGLPLAWAQPFLSNLALAGGDLRGELVATTRSGGLALRSTSALTANGVSLGRAGRPLGRDLDLSFQISADYAPQGWLAELSAFSARSGAAPLLTLEAKAGQLAGGGQPVKATGTLVAQLPAWSAQPFAAGLVPLTQGIANLDFTASLGTKQEVQAKLTLRELVADVKPPGEKLPVVSVELRADIAADGKIAINAPVLLERGGRQSDLALTGSLTPAREKLVLDAQVTSANFVVEDARILGALFPAEKKPAAPAEAKPPIAPAPPWAGVQGTLTLALKKVVYSESFQASDVAGTLRIQGGVLTLERGRAGLGEGGELKLSGAVNFDARAPQPYALAADFALTEFDPAPLFRAIAPGQPATVEGKFNATSRLAGRAATLGDLATDAGGEFQLTSHGGVFRGLPVNVTSKLETTGAIAAGIAKLGSLATALGAKSDKHLDQLASKAQAIAELVNTWKTIPYDQLSVVVARDASLNTVLKDFTLISPELRLSGAGQATHRPGARLLDEALTMEFKLRARGRNAELLKYLGELEPATDELGYAACTLPLKIGGTLGKPDTSELNQRLMAIALEKSGVTEKAADLFNKLIGGAK